MKRIGVFLMLLAIPFFSIGAGCNKEVKTPGNPKAKQLEADAKKGEAKKDEAKKDEAKKGEAKKDEAKK